MAHRPGGLRRVVVWDLPVRLFHWALATAIAAAFITVWQGRMEWHMYCGYVAATLVVFRVIWGVIGSETARFTQFVRGPAAILRYLREGTIRLGHNPLGALSVLALLAVVLVQAGTGLFSNDDIFFDGPWTVLVTKDVSDDITGYHGLNKSILLVLIALHLFAIGYYRYKGQDLIGPMIDGGKAVPSAISEPVRRPLWLAALCLAVAAAVVGVLFRLWGPWA